MLRLGLLLGPLIFLLWVFCLVHVITSREDGIRHLPRIGWLLIVLFFPFVGSILWLVAGRPVAARAPRSRYERPAPAFPEYDRPGRAASVDPAADEEFLRKCRERAEEQRRRAREQKQRETEGDEV